MLGIPCWRSKIRSTNAVGNRRNDRCNISRLMGLRRCDDAAIVPITDRGTLESVSMSHKECSAQAASRFMVAAGKSCFFRGQAAATKNNSIANAV